MPFSRLLLVLLMPVAVQASRKSSLTSATMKLHATSTTTTTTTMKTCEEEVQQVLRSIQWTEAIKSRSASKAGKIKVFKMASKDDKNATWASLFPMELWPKAHKFERKRMLGMGRLSNTSDEESTVRGLCDMSLLAMKVFSHSAKFINAMVSMLPSAQCQARPMKELSELTMDAMQNMCFGNCISTIEVDTGALTSDMPCEPEAFEGERGTKFYTELVAKDEQCAATPVDTLEWISTYTLFRRCRTFVPPTKNYVWRIDDKGPFSVSNTVCQLPTNTSKPKKKDIFMKGTCPEGSKCKCPMTELKARDTSSMIRFHGKQHIFSMTGVAALPTIMKQYASGYVISTVVLQMGLNGLALAAAALATLEAPMFLAMGTLVLGIKFGVSYAKFQCGQTVGCWPQHPQEVRTTSTETPKACRMPAKTKEGGSPLWFLPPPFLKMSHSKKQCILKACTKDELWSQRIGFGNDARSEGKYPGNPNVYNCQPMTYEEMTPELRKEFVKRLVATGVANEYDLPDAK